MMSLVRRNNLVYDYVHNDFVETKNKKIMRFIFIRNKTFLKKKNKTDVNCMLVSYLML
jgi:hypothetical protein